MKIELNTQKLQNALSCISRIGFNSKNINIQQKGIQFTFNIGRLLLYAYNGSEACEYVFGEVPVNENFIKILDFTMLNNIISNSSSESLIVEFKATNVTVKDKKSKYDIQYISKESLPYVFEKFIPGLQPVITLSDISFDSAFSFLSPCIPSSGHAAYLNGVYLDGNAVSTDKSSMAVYPLFPKMPNKNFFITSDSFKILTKNITKETTFSFYILDGNLLCVTDTFKLMLRLMENPFPDYKSVVSKMDNFNFKVSVKTKDLIAACRRLTSLGVSFGSMNFSMSFLRMQINSEKAQGMEELEALEPLTDLGDGMIEFKISFEKLLSCLARIKSDKIDIYFDSNTAQYKVQDGDAFYIHSIIRR